MKQMVFGLIALLPMTAAADVERGERLHAQHCQGCHQGMIGGDGSTLYTRADRRVRSLPALGRQVNRCKDNLGLRLFDEEVSDIVHYLNQSYYRFEE